MMLVNSKIRLPVEMPLLSRPRLLDRLRESMRCCASTLIVGRAGSGKTQLCADFARRSGRRYAWFKVDSSELELPIFLSYLIASVRLVWPAFGASTLELLDRLTPTFAAEPDANRYAESLLCDLTEERAQPLLVVIDDLHLVYDADWLIPFFSRLLPLLPPEAHLVVTGRSALPAPLWRMRSKQTLCFIDEAELAFTTAEAQLLYRHYGLSPAEAKAALFETRGRAAHLHALLTRALAERGSVPLPARNIAPEDLPPRGKRLRSAAEASREERTRTRH